MAAHTPQIEEIRARSWAGSGHELVALLGHQDPDVRSAAAVRLAEIDPEECGLPDLAYVLAELAERDAVNPGVADAFWATFVYSVRRGFDLEQEKTWVQRVLEARRGRPRFGEPGYERSPCPGNDLEFHAHEMFDDDVGALSRLLEWGYLDVVERALDHSALARDEWIALAEAVYARRKPDGWFILESLATNHGVVHPDLAARAPRIAFAGTSAIVVTTTAREWQAVWLFPHPRAAVVDLEDLGALFDALVAAGLELPPVEVPFAPEVLACARFPMIPGTVKLAALVRADAHLALAVNAGAVVAARVVRSKARPC